MLPILASYLRKFDKSLSIFGINRFLEKSNPKKIFKGQDYIIVYEILPYWNDAEIKNTAKKDF